MLNKPASYRLANRKVEQAMLDRVVEYNDSPLDKWLGIGYMRETNIFNLERDFVAQRYSLGIVGTVLYLVAYPAVIVCGGMAWLRRRERRTFYLSSLLFASCLILGASYMSGNVLDFPTSNLLLAFVDGGILAYIKKKRSAKRFAFFVLGAAWAWGSGASGSPSPPKYANRTRFDAFSPPS